MKISKNSILKELRNPVSIWQTWVLTLIPAFAYLYRAFPYFIKPQLFAEDGILWLSEGVNKGTAVITLKPYAGFFHFPERLFGFLTAQLPLQWAPALFALAAWALFIIMVFYLLSNRTKILSRNYERVFFVLCLCLLANFREFHFNFSNSVFLMGIIGALLMIAGKSKYRAVNIAEKIFFVLACLCLPFAWFYVPMALFDRFKYKAKNTFYLCAAVVTAIAQYIGYSQAATNRSPVTLVSVFSKYTLLIIYNQIIIPATRFARIDLPVGDYEVNRYPVIFVGLTIAILLAATWLVLRKSKKQVWLFLFFLAGMTFASIKSPSLSVPTAKDALRTMAVLSGGNRYFIFGIIAVTIVLIKFSYEVVVPKYRYVFMGVFLTFGLLSSIHYHSFLIDKQWNDYTAQYQQSVRDYHNGQKDVIIPVNPAPWTMGLFKQ